MKTIFLMLLMSFPVMAQDFNLDNFVPVADDVEQVTPDFQPIDLGNLSFEDESQARIEEMRKLAEEIKAIAEEIKKNNESTKMTFDDSKYLTLEDRVSKLENDSLNYVTKEGVTEIVKEEIKKIVKITMKNGNTVIEKEVPLNMTDASMVYNSVSVPGYSGTFDVPVGSFITHIDGVPVSRSRISNGVVTNYSNGYLMQGNRNNSRRFRIAAPVSSCRVVNGIMQCN